LRVWLEAGRLAATVLATWTGLCHAQSTAGVGGPSSVPSQGAADAGSLVFKAEYRGKLGTSLSPQALGPTLGYAGLTAVALSDADAPLTNFHWTQAFADNRFAVIAGVVDVTDHLDVYALVNPWTEFNNLSFSTNPTIPGAARTGTPSKRTGDGKPRSTCNSCPTSS
jgi:porin